MDVSRRTLFESKGFQIELFEVRPRTEACGGVERQSLNAVVLPFSGLFSKHESPTRSVTGTPSHAVYFRREAPYRISFPGAIGDRAIILRFDDALAPNQTNPSRGESPASQGLLPARAMMLRNLIIMRLRKGESEQLETGVLGLELLGMSLKSLREGGAPVRLTTQARRIQALERVKEAVAQAPTRPWTVARLAEIAGLSPFHLCRVFRQMVGTSVYDYVLPERLASTLDAVLDGGDGLTAIALDAGFASHSHFTARFRTFFGCTPTRLRHLTTAARAAELRKIMTARFY